MDVFNAISLGIIQGLTEFLPISSSGHLIIARDLFGWHGSTDLAFDAVLQLATILAVVFYFWKDILKLLKSLVHIVRRKEVDQKNKILLKAIFIGTIPAIIFGVLLESYMETAFRSAILVSVILILGSGLMLLAEKFAKKNTTLTAKKGLMIGFFQCLALIPGFSRSGSTISGGLLLGLTREEAAKFSFLLSIPIISGAGLKKFVELIQSGTIATDNVSLFFGCLTAFVVGLFAIDFLMKFLKNNSLNIFIYYRVILAVVVLAILLPR